MWTSTPTWTGSPLESDRVGRIADDGERSRLLGDRHGHHLRRETRESPTQVCHPNGHYGLAPAGGITPHPPPRPRRRGEAHLSHPPGRTPPDPLDPPASSVATATGIASHRPTTPPPKVPDPASGSTAPAEPAEVTGRGGPRSPGGRGRRGRSIDPPGRPRSRRPTRIPRMSLAVGHGACANHPGFPGLSLDPCRHERDSRRKLPPS